MTAGRRQHTPEVPLRTDVQKAHAYTHSHNISLSLQHLYIYCCTDVHNGTNAHTHPQMLGTDSIKDQNEARRDLAERHGMFRSLIFDCEALSHFSHRCPPEREEGQEVGCEFTVLYTNRCDVSILE